MERAFVVVSLLLLSGAFIPLLRLQSGFVPDPVQGDPLMQTILLAVYGATPLLLLRNRRAAMAVARRDKILWVLIGLAVLSALWSRAPAVTLRRSVALVGTTLLGIYFAGRYEMEEQLRLLAWAVGIAVVASLLFGFMLPAYGLQPETRGVFWRGIYNHKNTLGRLVTLGAVVFVLRLKEARGQRAGAFAMLALSVVLLLLSGSKTALVIALGLAALLPLYSAARWHYSLYIPLFIVAVLVSTAAATWLLGNYETVLTALGRDVTLTGRTELWSVVLEMIRRRPWLGYGFSGFWLGWEGESYWVWQAVGWDVPHAHNGFLDLMLDLGVVGLVLFGAVYVRSFVVAARAIRAEKSAAWLWPLCYLTFMLLYNFTESAILRHNSLYWALYVASSLSASCRGTAVARNLAAEPRKHTGTPAYGP